MIPAFSGHFYLKCISALYCLTCSEEVYWSLPLEWRVVSCFATFYTTSTLMLSIFLGGFAHGRRA